MERQPHFSRRVELETLDSHLIRPPLLSDSDAGLVRNELMPGVLREYSPKASIGRWSADEEHGRIK